MLEFAGYRVFAKKEKDSIMERGYIMDEKKNINEVVEEVNLEAEEAAEAAEEAVEETAREAVETVEEGAEAVAEDAAAYRAGIFVDGAVKLAAGAALTDAIKVVLRGQNIVFDKKESVETFDNTVTGA